MINMQKIELACFTSVVSGLVLIVFLLGWSLGNDSGKQVACHTIGIK